MESGESRGGNIDSVAYHTRRLKATNAWQAAVDKNARLMSTFIWAF